MNDVSKRHRTVWPKTTWVLSDPGRFMMFGLGSGLIRPGSGTWGTCLAWLLWNFAAPGANNLYIGLFLLISFFYGCWAANRVAKELGVPDHVGIVWDEFVAFWLLLWVIPFCVPVTSPNSWKSQIAAFVLFRLFDTIKPPPIKMVDARFKGGIGVMADDLLAAGYALLIMLILANLGLTF